MIIDGKKISKDIYNNLKQEITSLSSDRVPCLGAILVGNNPASLRYIKQKKKRAEYIGMSFVLQQFDETLEEEELLECMDVWNDDQTMSGYIVQLPLPKHIDTNKVLNRLAPEKDVDGFHPINQGKILVGDQTGFAPCTPAGVMGIFDYISNSSDYGINGYSLSGKHVVVIGRSNIVGKPVAAMMIYAGATVTVCNSKTKDISSFTKKADIIILAAGSPGLLKKDMVSDSAIIIDVGFTVVDGKIYGDADYKSIEGNGNLITPVPGGVGRLTVAYLLKNTLKAYYL